MEPTFLTKQQLGAVEAAVKVLELAGITAWFEARIIKDSDKRLNGVRIGRRKDFDGARMTADRKRVGMQPDMRMELRMYATVASSRAVFMGQEVLPPSDKLMAGALVRAVKHVAEGGDYGGMVEGRANYSPSKNVERLVAEGAPDRLIQQAQAKVRLTGMPANPDAPLARMRTVAGHTCDAAGPMRQREQGGPFISTCSMCGGFQ